MAYKKHTFRNGDVLYASTMTEMDDQIAQNEATGINALNGVGALNQTANSLDGRLKSLEENGVPQADLAAAVEAYFAANPIKVDASAIGQTVWAIPWDANNTVKAATQTDYYIELDTPIIPANYNEIEVKCVCYGMGRNGVTTTNTTCGEMLIGTSSTKKTLGRVYTTTEATSGDEPTNNTIEMKYRVNGDHGVRNEKGYKNGEPVDVETDILSFGTSGSPIDFDVITHLGFRLHKDAITHGVRVTITAR